MFATLSYRHRCRRWQQGAVLLEVILALALFVAAAAIISAGMSASIKSVERLRLNTHAANLAISVLSELEMGMKTMALSGPQPFQPPFEEWTWEAQDASGKSEFSAAGRFKKVEVIIRHADPDLVYRLSQIVQTGETKSVQATNPSTPSGRQLAFWPASERGSVTRSSLARGQIP